jgi:hypothetical protein
LRGKPEGKILLGRPGRRWKNNIEMVYDGIVHWINLAQDRDYWRALVNTEMNLQVP